MRRAFFMAAGLLAVSCGVFSAVWAVEKRPQVPTGGKLPPAGGEGVRAADKFARRDRVAGGGKVMALDRVLNSENDGRQLQTAEVVDDLAFLRRVTVDLIGRIPKAEEIDEYLGSRADERRASVVDRLLADDRFADRWTVFFGDLLRLRSQADGGAALTAYVHRAIAEGIAYDVMCRQLLSANGKAGKVPEVGFVLNDGADPMALAAATAQVFMGVRISCAQCHDHPFDVWKREQFYGLAAYFGKTRRVESYLTKAIYTTESDQSVVLWPPEGKAAEEDRKPMQPAFPFAMDPESPVPPHVARFVAGRKAAEEKLARDSPTPAIRPRNGWPATAKSRSTWPARRSARRGTSRSTRISIAPASCGASCRSW